MLRFPREQQISQKEADLLGFQAYAESLAHCITIVDPPYSIGVTGAWGAGKSSLMELARSELDGSEVLPVWFEAWKYDNSQNLLYPLVKSIKKTVQPTSNIDANLSRIFKASALVGYNALAATAKHFVGADFELDTIKGTMELVELTENRLSVWVDEVDSLRTDAARYVEEVLNKTKANRICVFIDDLDRCSPTIAIELLENIRIHFDVPGLVFVIGVSRQVIEDGIKAKYGLGSEQTGPFLDKLLNLDFPVPHPQLKLEEFIWDFVCKCVGEPPPHFEDLTKCLADGCDEAGLRNPRLVKRLAARIIILEDLLIRTLDIPITKEIVYMLIAKHHCPVFFEAVLREPKLLSVARSYLEGSEGRQNAKRQLGEELEASMKGNVREPFLRRWYECSDPKEQGITRREDRSFAFKVAGLL